MDDLVYWILGSYVLGAIVTYAGLGGQLISLRKQDEAGSERVS
jgi:hypothetical protein